MHKLTALFLALLLISTGGHAAAHGLEPIETIVAAEAAGTAHAGHWAGDGDEVPADSDRGYPHHHGGCHDHGVGVPATAERLPLRASISQTPARHRPARLAAADPASLLRPPRA